MLDILQIVFLVVTCAVCYLAGNISGATGFARVLINNKIITEEDLEKLQVRLKK